MNPQAAADTAVLFSAVLTLVAIASKLITANLLARTKKNLTKLEARRRETVSRLKEVQLKTTSARGTLEFWERRRTETKQRVFDAERDVETYAAQLGAEVDVDDADAAGDGAAVEATAGGDDGELLEAPPESLDEATPAAASADKAGAGESEAQDDANEPDDADDGEAARAGARSRPSA